MKDGSGDGFGGSGYGYGSGGYGDGSGGYGYGYGSGGYGDGSGGYGDGYGSGSGDGSGSGYGSGGSGYGYGYGSGGDGSGGYGSGGYGYGSGGSGYGYGYGSGDGYGDGDGDGYGDGNAYFGVILEPFTVSNLASGIVAFWKSNRDGTPANGGAGTRARVGLTEQITGPLQICTEHALHGTGNPRKWKGERWWVVALHGEYQRDEDKFASLKRTFLADLGKCPFVSY